MLYSRNHDETWQLLAYVLKLLRWGVTGMAENGVGTGSACFT